MDLTVDIIKGTSSDRPDDLLVVCASFEERSCAILNRLSGDYRVRNGLIFFYVDGARKPWTDQRESLEILKQGLQRFCLNEVRVVNSEIDNPREGVSSFLQATNDLEIDLSSAIVTVDISTLTKQYQMSLLKNIDSRRANGKLRAVYTCPSYYRPRMLTEGVRFVRLVPGFEGSFDVNKPNLLITFLGFERDRALAVWNELEPERTIPILGTEPNRTSWLNAARRMNHALLQRPGVEEPIGLPAYDPYAVWLELGRIYRERSANSNVYIAPIGTKPQVLGVYLLVARDMANVRVIYPTPYKYKPAARRKETGLTYEYPL